jgi:hypothetical protein
VEGRKLQPVNRIAPRLTGSRDEIRRLAVLDERFCEVMLATARPEPEALLLRQWLGSCRLVQAIYRPQ